MAKTKSTSSSRQKNSPSGKQNSPTENELLENPDALREKVVGQGEVFVRRNRNLILGVFALIALVVAGVIFYGQYRRQQNVQAQEEMFMAVNFFENDSLSLALNGDGNHVGLLYIADEYGGTKAGNLAHYYIGAIYLQQGQFQQAVDHLKKFSADDFLVQARAHALTGDAYMEMDNYAEAARFYGKAADHQPNEYFTPIYLLKKALAHEQANQLGEAVEAYDRLIRDYPNAADVATARKYRARTEALRSAQ